MKNLLNTLALTTVIATLTLSASAYAQAPASFSEIDVDEKTPITLTFFFHDDVPDNVEKGTFHNDYIAWFLKELKAISGKEVDFEYFSRRPGYTDFNYKSENAKHSLDEWSKRAWEYTVKEYGSTDIRPKIVLVTGSDINSGTAGITYHQRSAAIASISSYRNIAHEVGHMLGATHENSETRLKNGWWCESNMSGARNKAFSNCYEFSQKNRAAISDYLKTKQ